MFRCLLTNLLAVSPNNIADTQISNIAFVSSKERLGIRAITERRITQ